ncbi:hypothetical protein D3C71_2016690 [compost metagenome]
MNFLSTCKGNRPDIVSRIPTVIYNDVWVDTLNEFCQMCNVRYTRFIAFMVNHPEIKRQGLLHSMECYAKQAKMDEPVFEMVSYCRDTQMDFELAFYRVI